MNGSVETRHDVRLALVVDKGNNQCYDDRAKRAKPALVVGRKEHFMAQTTDKSNARTWFQEMPSTLDHIPLDKVRFYLLARLREINSEIDQISRSAPSTDWLLQRAGAPFVDLNASAWDPLLYLEYLKATRRAIVATIQML
jgi:hypothetical protein